MAAVLHRLERAAEFFETGVVAGKSRERLNHGRRCCDGDMTCHRNLSECCLSVCEMVHNLKRLNGVTTDGKTLRRRKTAILIGRAT
jgi:hypothetical protein